MNRILKKLGKGGFTTLDILMVMVIIGVLSMITVPRFLQAHDRGHLAAAQMDVTSLRNALAMYAADYDAYPNGLNSLQDIHDAAVDRDGKSYMTLPTGETFDFISYRRDIFTGYLLRVRAHDQEKTIIRATAEGLTTE